MRMLGKDRVIVEHRNRDIAQRLDRSRQRLEFVQKKD
jgi:hypothetical protein